MSSSSLQSMEKSLNAQRLDEVIVPANTYIASILAITENNFIPRLIEPDEVTSNISPENIMEFNY